MDKMFMVIVNQIEESREDWNQIEESQETKNPIKIA